MESLMLLTLMMLVFITVVYYSRKRKPTYQHKLFTIMVIITYLSLGAESYVNFLLETDNLNLIRHTGWMNDVYQLVTYAYLFVTYKYVRFMTTEEEKISFGRRIVAFLPLLLFAALSIIFTIRSNDYQKHPEQFRCGSVVMPMAAGFYCVIAFIYIVKYWTKLDQTIRLALVMALCCQGGITAIQAINSAGIRMLTIGMVIMAHTFYMTVESPDVLLIERLEYEKERADRANEAKSAFLANMSHEIRTPMNAIVGMTDIMLRTELTPQQGSYLNNIKHSGKSLLLIINDLLDFSKIEAGKMELVEEAYDPMSICNDISMILLNRLDDKPVELIFDIDKNIPARLFGDPGRIKQIILNLLSNAVKFTENGYVKLTIKQTSQIGRIANFDISVEDTGQGIKKEDIDVLFNAFEQVDLRRNRTKEGSGLGLSICKQLAELMGGTISVTSEYGKGSKFTVSIKQKVLVDDCAAQINPDIYAKERPVIGGVLRKQDTDNVKKMVESYELAYMELAEEDLDATIVNHLFVDEEVYLANRKKLEKLAEAGVSIGILQNPMKNSFVVSNMTVINKPIYTATFVRFMNHEKQDEWNSKEERDTFFTAPKAHVLIVDDNDMNLKVAAGLLGPLNMHIDLARSGKEAIDMSKAKKYDIILMDHMMPVMDGVETSKHIRELEEFDRYYANDHIVALTANVGMDAKDAFSEVGVNEFLTKPIEINHAVAVIKKLLPEDYIERSSVPVIEEVDTSDDNELPEIEGLDVAEGIKNSGTRELFEELLGDFYTIIDMKSSKIEKCLADGLIHDFTIEVHALKNTARMIGALELSEMFKDLEMLGHDEKVDEIMSKVSGVLEKYRSYKPILRPWAVKNEEDKETVDTSVIIEVLNDMKEAMDSFDLDRVDDDMNKLDGYRMKEDAMQFMDSLRAYVADVAMEDVIKTADYLINFLGLEE